MDKTSVLVAAVKKLSSTDPNNPATKAALTEVMAAVDALSVSDKAPVVATQDIDVNFLMEQVKKLHQAAETPIKNYSRMMSITAGLGRAIEISKRPQNAEVRPRIATIVEKVAGLFAEVDTAEDLDRPLAEIEKAVHSLYGDQSKNSTLYFDRRNKGHHSDQKL